MMKLFSYIGKKLEQLCLCNQFLLELFYFLSISSIGYFILHSVDRKTTTFTPRRLDLFFTSVSAATVSSMSTVEMEVFSDTQLIILTILMVIGGEVFISMVILHLRHHFQKDLRHSTFREKIELHNITIPKIEENNEDLNYKPLKFLGRVVMFYLVFVQLLGVVSVFIYIDSISSAKDILKKKGLVPVTFSFFTVVSTFGNCGFVPTNENMIIFRKNSGLLLILIPQILLGNTLYAPVLRLWMWAIGKFTKKAEARYLLKNSKLFGYHYLLPRRNSLFLGITVLVFIVVQFILFSSMEWSSSSLGDLNVYQKAVGILFQTVNTRHTGESIVDLSTVSASVLVLFVVMMYLPPSTTFLPVTKETTYEKGIKRSNKIMENLIFSQLSYLVIFVILICITERKHIIQDPLNFNVLNIVLEVVRMCLKKLVGVGAGTRSYGWRLLFLQTCSIKS